MPVDPLSDVLGLMEARYVFTGGITAGGTWGRRFWPEAQLKLMAVVRGSCWLTVNAGQPVLLEAGQVAVVNGWEQVGLADSPDTPLTDVENTVQGEASLIPATGVFDGETTVVVGGHIDVNQAGEDLLLAVLPPLTLIHADADEARAIGWLLERMVREITTTPPGASFVAHQHAQLLLVEVFRAYLAGGQSLPPGWLRAIADPSLAPALKALHASPGHPWSLEELAHLAAMSRTTFVDRFKAAAGVPPMTYLHEWRIRLAERELRTSDTPVRQLAPTFGYGSESAFSNAFKRATGLSPRHYRDAHRERHPV